MYYNNVAKIWIGNSLAYSSWDLWKIKSKRVEPWLFIVNNFTLVRAEWMWVNKPNSAKLWWKLNGSLHNSCLRLNEVYYCLVLSRALPCIHYTTYYTQTMFYYVPYGEWSNLFMWWKRNENGNDLCTDVILLYSQVITFHYV